MKLNFAWWNTSLSPLATSNKNTDDKRDIALSVLEVLANDYDADVIGLGEISSEDISTFRPKWEALGYSIFDGVVPAGRTRFDTCVLYKTSKLLLLDHKHIDDLKGTATLKVAQRLDFLFIEDDDTIIHLFISHWPSRLWCEENNADRFTLGDRLRSAAEKVGLGTYVIIMGDFNDDPFSPSMEMQLMATRDRNLAIRRDHLLYNPFWRMLGAMAPYNVAGAENRYSGSYHYRKGSNNGWHTFDQIIFSSTFLGKSKWHLREELVQILDISPYTDLVLGSDYNFDHLPVIGVIEKTV